MLNKAVIIPVAVAVIAGGGGFYGGMKYQESQSPKTVTFQGQPGQATMIQGSGPNGQRGNGSGQRLQQGFRPVLGEIIAQDDKTITVKMEDGSSKIINISDTTTINKSSEGSKSDLTTGQKVSVFGTENSDGSVTATNVQLNPQMRIMQGNQEQK